MPIIQERSSGSPFDPAAFLLIFTHKFLAASAPIVTRAIIRRPVFALEKILIAVPLGKGLCDCWSNPYAAMDVAVNPSKQSIEPWVFRELGLASLGDTPRD